MSNTEDIRNGIHNLFNETGFVNRVKGSPNPDAVNNLFKTFDEVLSKETHQTKQDVVLAVLNVLGSLPHRAGRKSCVEAVREYFKVNEVPSNE